MKKLLNMVKRITLMIGGFCTSMYTKVLGIGNINDNELHNILMNTDELYGPPHPDKISTIWKVAKSLIIPLAFIIGVSIYFKKSKSSKKKKILVTIEILVLIILIYIAVIGYYNLLKIFM